MKGRYGICQQGHKIFASCIICFLWFTLITAFYSYFLLLNCSYFNIQVWFDSPPHSAGVRGEGGDRVEQVAVWCLISSWV